MLRIYGDHRKLTAIQLEPAGEGYRFDLRVREGKAQGFIVRGRVAPSGTVTVEERLPSLLSCPVCLAPGTRIATPHGPVAVADLRAGDPVWTLDDAGRRVAATILKTARVPVHAGHRMVHLRLEDGRELRASPGHPTADGRRIDRLRVGDLVDGARVARITEDGEPTAATFDLLPSGLLATTGRTGY